MGFNRTSSTETFKQQQHHQASFRGDQGVKRCKRFAYSRRFPGKGLYIPLILWVAVASADWSPCWIPQFPTSIYSNCYDTVMPAADCNYSSGTPSTGYWQGLRGKEFYVPWSRNYKNSTMPGRSACVRWMPRTGLHLNPLSSNRQPHRCYGCEPKGDLDFCDWTGSPLLRANIPV